MKLGFAAAFVLLTGPALAQMQGHTHDMSRMPGLQGENATQQESQELAIMFRHFRDMHREVTNLPDGIRTNTTATSPYVREALVSHVIGMIDRVETGDDPKIRIQSPTLNMFFERHDSIITEIDVTEDGVVVIQTSDDPEMVEALQVHAAEVTAMVERGMHAVHEMMMQRRQSH
jgi:hypothetical protein